MGIPKLTIYPTSLPLDDCCTGKLPSLFRTLSLTLVQLDMTYLNWKLGPFTSILRRQREKVGAFLPVIKAIVDFARPLLKDSNALHLQSTMRT
jgi:hypothetical protein